MSASELKLDRDLCQRKAEVLAYYRSRADESLTDITQTFGSQQYKKRASAINDAIAKTRDKLSATLRQAASREDWAKDELLSSLLMLFYCGSVTMLEYRNSVWSYEYMTFSRRVGELWQRFCALPFEHPLRDEVRLFTPPLFKDIQKVLTQEIRDYIYSLPLTSSQKEELLRYYDKVWSLVTSGEINLELDVHFQLAKTKYVIDLKSGFSSNEKGNTNRLLLVGSIYKNVEREDYQCLMFVRQKEDENNHYLQILKNSGLWEVFCSYEAYDQMKKLTGFDIHAWMDKHIDWHSDLSAEAFGAFSSRNLLRYLKWS
jgi:hypothetical protein